MKLKDFCDISAGGTPSRSNNEYWDNGNIPWLKISDLKNKYIDNCDEYITEKALNNSSAKLYLKGTILYTIFATIGEVAILDFDATTNQAIAGIKITDRSLQTEYLYYYLKSLKQKMLNESRGVAQNNINLSILRELDIRVPSLDKQNKIIKTLSKLEKLIETKKSQILSCNNLIKSQFVEMFGTPFINEKKFEILKTSDVCTKVTDGSHFSPKDNGTGIPMLSVKDMRNDGFHYDNCKYVTLDDYEQLKKQGCKPEINDVLIAKDGSYFYYGFVVQEDKEQAVLSSIAILRPDVNLINPYYLCYYMLSNEVVKYVGEHYVTGAALKRVILKGIRDIDVLVPPIELQNKFAQIVEQIDKQKFEFENSLKKLEELQASLMQEYFG